MEVKLLNPEDVRTFLKETGLFASVCTDSSSDPERIAIHCLSSGHLSTTRWSSFKFNIKGVSRVCSHQLVRHSQGLAINQRSQRYVRENEPTYVIPASIQDNPAALMRYKRLMEFVWSEYSALLDMGINADDSRFVLPNACTTELNMGFSFEALIHFFHERLCSRASWEIRAVAVAMMEAMLEIEPRLAPFFGPKCITTGSCKEVKGCERYRQFQTKGN